MCARAIARFEGDALLVAVGVWWKLWQWMVPLAMVDGRCGGYGDVVTSIALFYAQAYSTQHIHEKTVTAHPDDRAAC